MLLELNDANYTDLMQSSTQNIFIDFYSPSCGPCQELLSLLDPLDEYAKDKGVIVCKCDVTRNPKIAAKYMIQSVPVTVMVNVKKEVKDPNIGLASRAYYFNLIDKYTIGKESFLKRLFS